MKNQLLNKYSKWWCQVQECQSVRVHGVPLVKCVYTCVCTMYICMYVCSCTKQSLGHTIVSNIRNYGKIIIVWFTVAYMYTIIEQPKGWNVFVVICDLQRRICTQQLEQSIWYIVNTLQPIGHSNYCVYILLCKPYTYDLTTVPYIGDDCVALRMFCTTAHRDDGPVTPETCRSFVN
jgi:hypothetical protein